ncbi:hypothetical protein RINTU1_26820 [Candidatus Regiella insecticola]|uniref:Uncharacterized protein n=1 Tax=Candidatus Regiella insecticola TaxID=138073 RepID=A0A6L2ZRN5_9ENTR|nr:hypothetical protein RINTU1_26820 [Candidatus Regiella insecticola]
MSTLIGLIPWPPSSNFKGEGDIQAAALLKVPPATTAQNQVKMI